MLSVIIPVRNAQNTILKSLDSVLNQKYVNFEILIGIDKSHDSTVQLLDKYRSFPNIRIYEFYEPMGISAILNHLILHSRGDYIVRMDADDVMLENRMKLQFDFMEQNPFCGVLASRSITNKSSGTISKDESRQLFCADFLNINPISHPTVVFRRIIFDKNHSYYNPLYKRSQDYELWIRLVRETNIFFLDIPAINYHSDVTLKKIILQFYYFSRVKYKNLLWHLFIKKCDCDYKDVSLALIRAPRDFKFLFADIFKILIH
jgi:glycosyltransferase involved in cell wall biosynthesis